MTKPILYTSSVEQPDGDEHALVEKLTDAMLGISQKTFADSGKPMRSVHAKAHGLIYGELRVGENLPPELAQGIFAQPGSYPIIMRFSSTPGDMLPDSISTPRGLAVKLIGVPGQRLPGSEGDTTQDYVMVNGPAFQNKDAHGFLRSVQLLEKTTDKMEGVKVVASKMLRGVESAIEAIGGTSATIRSMGGEPPHHPLGETYFTQVPLLHGDYMSKVCIAPVSDNLKRLKGQELPITENPLALREAVTTYFAANGGEWDIRVQLCTDLEKMPIEDASVVWPETESHYITVGHITVKPQAAWDETTSPAINDRLSFSPWHGIAAHRPIGSVMRVRKAVYEKAVAFRAQHSGIKITEPRNLQDLQIVGLSLNQTGNAA